MEIAPVWTLDLGTLGSADTVDVSDDDLLELYRRPGEWYDGAPVEGFWRLGVKLIFAHGLDPYQRSYLLWQTPDGLLFSPPCWVQEDITELLMPAQPTTAQVVSLEEVVWATMGYQVDRLMQLESNVKIRVDNVGFRRLPSIQTVEVLFQAVLVDDTATWETVLRYNPNALARHLTGPELADSLSQMHPWDVDLISWLPFPLGTEEPEGELNLYIQEEGDDPSLGTEW